MFTSGVRGLLTKHSAAHPHECQVPPNFEEGIAPDEILHADAGSEKQGGLHCVRGSRQMREEHPIQVAGGSPERLWGEARSLTPSQLLTLRADQ